MGKINRIIAIALDRRSKDGNGGNCKVIGIEIDNEYVDSQDVILEIFHTSGFIFSNKVYEYGDNIQVKDLIEIIPSGDINFEAEPNKNIFVYIKQVKKIGTPIIDVPSDFVFEDYLDLENISNFLNSKNLIPDHFTRIYLCDNKDLFGPFKIENNRILLVGKETNAFEYHFDELIEDDLLDYLYLLEEPKEKIKIIDCSTPKQLVEFLKDRIAIDRADLNLILKIGQELSKINNNHLGLDKVRIKRAEAYLNQLKFSFEEIQRLSSNELWRHLIQDTINQNKNEFEKIFIRDLNDKLTELSNDIKVKETILEKYNSTILAKQKEIEEIQKQLIDIESRKIEIVNTIKVLADLQPNSFIETNTQKIIESLNNIEYLNHLTKVPAFTDLDNFYDELRDEYKFRISKQSDYENGLILLKESSFLLAKCTEFVVNLVAHIGNAKIAIQNAEADWLKFNYWKENGLLAVINDANFDKDHKYFYVLQDFNIASFECYGKPVIDISNKIRSTIDGIQILPPNLTIILVRTDEEIENFGFELNKSTFKNWKCLPSITSVRLQEFPIDIVIDLNKLEFNHPAEDYSDQYF